MALGCFLRTFTLLLGLFLLFSPANAQCWYPDHETETTDIPCNNDGGFSACCNVDAFCLDNGLCMSGGLVSRGSCTDKTWTSAACSKYCSGDSDSPSTGVALQPCNDAANTWTCGTSNSNCVNNVGVFVINKGNGIVLRASQVAALQTGSSTAMTIEPTTVLKVEDEAAAGNNGTSEASQGAASLNGSGLFTAGQMAGVGAGVGLPLLLALLGAIFVILQQRKRLQRQGPAGPAMTQPAQWSAAAYTQSSAQSPGYENYAPLTKPSETYYHDDGRRGHYREMDSAQVNELDSSASRQELPAILK